MSGVTITGLAKAYKQFVAVSSLDLEVRDGEFLTLLGPSGCGKTTTLRCVAGLETATGGRVMLGDKVVSEPAIGVHVQPQHRDIGMVFQNYALWPHMSVSSNVAYPLKQRGTSRKDVGTRVREALEIVGLADHWTSLVTSLSGGQQQRVALARAIVSRPQLLLYDEPLSNLDAKLRHSMRSEIRRLHRQNGTTSLYVTHDQEEAIALSDRIVVMSNGAIQQVSSPREVYEAPVNRFVADFVGFDNIFDGTVSSVGEGSFGVRLGDERTSHEVVVDGFAPGPVGTSVCVAFRRRHTVVGAAADGAVPTASARVVDVAFLGDRTECDVDLDGAVLKARLEDSLAADLARHPDVGDLVPVCVTPGAAVVVQP